jgi:hypothetical protein
VRKRGDRGVYLCGNEDLSYVRVGHGEIPNRPIAHLASYLVVLSQIPFPRRDKGRPSTEAVFHVFNATNGRAWFAVLANDISKERAQYGENAVMSLLGIRRYHGQGWLINEKYA